MKTVHATQTSAAEDQQLVDLVEEITSRLQAGQSCDVDQYAARFPEYADRLREWVGVMSAMADLGHSLQPEVGRPTSATAGRSEFASANLSSSARPNAQITGLLGDFRILRELGRGGMGVVYEAEQISIGRRVALKVLPFAAMLDKQQLARFKNEARAAGTLDHPNIVVIHSVGSERGVHYYAMQLVEGQSLAEVIAQLKGDCPNFCASARKNGAVPLSQSAVRNPQSEIDTAPIAHLSTLHAPCSSLPDYSSPEYYRAVAQLGIQAAEALDHAHQNGILHRDIKPANLLIDDAGKLWITDFGLARIEQDAGMTMTGDILGTLRYMSPEQALAKRAVVDHRSDIYSLGVTLYELIALQPVFSGEDRQELLRQIAFDNPRRPRQINDRIPRDLETIILKSIEKNPADRYVTAHDLADDLRRFHNDQSIRAKAPTFLQHVQRWSRRHQRFATVVGAATVLLCVVLAASMVAVRKAQRQTQAALEETSALLYTTDMTLAYEAFTKGWTNEVQTILDRHRPSTGKPDQRGFEWLLLQSLVQPPASFALTGHRGAVNELAVFPDQQRLASVGVDGTLRIWDLQSRRLVHTIDLCKEGLSSVAVSPDGRFVAAGTTDAYYARLWLSSAHDRRLLPPDRSTVVYLCDLEAGYQVSEVYHGRASVESIAFSRDSKRLAVGTRYDEVCLIALDGTVIHRVLTGARLDSLEFISNDGGLLVPNCTFADSLKKTQIAQLWREDLSTVENVLDCSSISSRGHITLAKSIPNSKTILLGERNSAQAHLFDLTRGRISASTPEARARINDLAVSPLGHAAAIAYQNGIVECLPIEKRKGELAFCGPPRIIGARQGDVLCVRFVSQDKLATCGTDGSIRVWSLADSNTQSFDISTRQSLGVRLSPDGKLLLQTFDWGHQVVECSNGRVQHDARIGSASGGPSAWSPASDRYAVCLSPKHERQVRTFRLNNELVHEFSHPGNPSAVEFSPSGQLLAVIGDKQLQICRADTGATLSQLPLRAEGLALAFSHAGDRLAYGGMFPQVVIQEIPGSGHLAEQRIECGIDTRCLAFSPDDSMLATGHGDGVVRLWDMATGRLRADLVGHERMLLDVAFSPDGRTLITAAQDGTARVWSVDQARCYGMFFGHDNSNRKDDSSNCRLSVSSDHRRLAIGFPASVPEDNDVFVVTIDSLEDQ